MKVNAVHSLKRHKGVLVAIALIAIGLVVAAMFGTWRLTHQGNQLLGNMPDAIAGYVHDGNLHEGEVDASIVGSPVPGWVSSPTGCNTGLWTLAWSAPSHQAKAAILTGQAPPSGLIDVRKLSGTTLGLGGQMQGNYCQQPIFFSVGGIQTIQVTVRYQFWRRIQPGGSAGRVALIA